MDSDQSLIEISGADDSLLQLHTPNDDACTVYSSCSPLCSVKSKPYPRYFGSMGKEAVEQSGSSFCRGSFDKENINVSKSDTLNLSIEPQQMKRKKKGGGYNLRKSLAWDRAFFTEEGVLDPMELSMICAGGEKLSVIHEEGRESLSEAPECEDDSADLLALEEKLFKDLPAKAPNERKARAAGATPQKHDGVDKHKTALPSPAKRKVLSAQDVNRSGSKHHGGPRPVTSLLKRPANVNSTKAANKESKVPRMPIPKQDSSTLGSTSKRSIPAGQLKRTHPAQPVIRTQKVTERSSSNNTKCAGNSITSRPGGRSSTVKSTLPQPKRNVSKVVSKLSSSTHKNHLEGVHHPANLPTHQLTNDQDGGSISVGVSLPQKIQQVGGQLVQNVPIQAAKPSGLRMPSPSMGFFAQQSKASAARNLGTRYAASGQIPPPTSSNPRNPSSMKSLHELRPPYSNEKVQGMVNGVKSGHMQIYSKEGSSASILRSELHGKESDVELCKIRKLKLQKYDLKTETSNSQQELQSSLDDVSDQYQECAKPHENSEVASHVALALGTKDVSVSMANSRVDSQHMEVPITNHPVETSTTLSTPDCSFFPQSESTSISGSSTESSLTWLKESEVLRNHGTAKNSDVSSRCGEDAASKVKRSQALHGSEFEGHGEDDFVGLRSSCKKLKKVEDPEEQFPADNLTEGRSSTFLIGSILEGQSTKYTDNVANIEEPAERPCYTVEQDFQDNESHEASGLLQAGTCANGISISDSFVPEPIAMQACGPDLVEVQTSHDAKLREEANCNLKLSPRMSKCQLTDVATNSEYSSIGLSRDSFGAMTTENEDFMSSILPAIESEDSPMIADLVKDESLKDRPYPRGLKNICATVQPREDMRCCEDTSPHNAFVSSNLDVHEQLAEKPMPDYLPGEADKQPQGERLIRSSEPEQNFNGSNLTIASLEVENFEVTEAKAYLADVCMNQSPSVADYQFRLAVDLDEQPDECHKHQDHLNVEHGSQHSHRKAKGARSLKETSGENFAIDGTRGELVSSNICVKAETNLQDGSPIVDNMYRKEHVKDVSSALAHENKLNDGRMGADASTEMIREQIPQLQTSVDSSVFSSLNDELHPVLDDKQTELSVNQIREDSPVKTGVFPEGAMAIDSCPPNVQTQHQLDPAIHYSVNHPAVENCKSDRKQDTVMVNPPPDVAPFSDEWLAAFEAAGEEILMMKSGAVQNSPPEKVLPEPGPWSPVKKKNNQVIGPFDCTKFTNPNVNIPHPSSQ